MRWMSFSTRTRTFGIGTSVFKWYSSSSLPCSTWFIRYEPIFPRVSKRILVGGKLCSEEREDLLRLLSFLVETSNTTDHACLLVRPEAEYRHRKSSSSSGGELAGSVQLLSSHSFLLHVCSRRHSRCSMFSRTFHDERISAISTAIRRSSIHSCVLCSSEPCLCKTSVDGPFLLR